MKTGFANIVSITLLFFILFQSYPYAQSSSTTADTLELRFKRLTVNDGLSQNYVTAMEQDSKGFMWFGTGNGLNKYDGYTFTLFTHNPFDTTTLSGNAIAEIFEDSRGWLWIKSQDNGFDIMDPHTGVVRRNPLTSDVTLGQIAEDSEGNIWIAGSDVSSLDVAGRLFGISQESIAKSNFELVQYPYHPDDPQILTIFPDDDGILWLGTSDGLVKFSRDVRNTLEIYHFDEEETQIWIDPIKAILKESDSTLWISSPKGLILFNKVTGSSTLYRHEEPNAVAISIIVRDRTGTIWTDKYIYAKSGSRYKRVRLKNFPQTVARVFKDRAGNIWMGSGYGLYVFFPESNRFRKFPGMQHKTDVQSLPSVRAIFEDSQKNLWFSTWSFIYKWDRTTNEVSTFGDMYDQKLFGSTGASAIAEDRNGTIWFVSYRGLTGYDLRSKKEVYRITDFPDMGLHGAFADRASEIWFVTGRHLRKVTDAARGQYVSYRFNEEPPQYGEEWHSSLYQDEEGIIWFTSLLGLVKFDQQSEEFTIYSNDPSDRTSISGNGTTSICPDPIEPMKKLWIGTHGGGLNLFDRETETFTHITQEDGLPNDVVYGILSDKRGNLWISTNRGLTRYDMREGRFAYYDVNDGLQNNEFNGGAFFKSKSGEMFFGGISGFNYFYPEDIANKGFTPPVVFTDFKLFNKSVSVRDSNSVLNRVISDTKEITLSYKESIFSLEFALFDYYAPTKNRFAYKLEGFNDDWIQLGTRREATFTNLDPGEYVLRVKGTDSDGTWSEDVASMKIIITPPFWKTWWAYMIYFVLIVSLLYGLRRYELNRVNWKNQSKLDEVKLKEREETDRMKSRFFANISHEFRTPLTLILGPLEKIKPRTAEEEIEKQAGLIRRNANRLLSLVNQLLDLSKLEAGKLKLNAAPGNIVPFIKGIAMSFESIADHKDIALKVKAANDDIQLYFDRDKVAKILTNLLSNAFKFTQDGGEITAHVSQTEQNSVEIRIRDTGIGISEEELPKLFDRFYQVDSSQTREHEGTGIGLALTKELVELHHGNISVESKKGDPDTRGTGWTEFTVELPLGKGHLKDDEIAETADDASVEVKDLMQIEYPIEEEKELSQAEDVSTAENGEFVEDEDKMLILVVEDNADVREYIKDSLGDNFQIEEASNGQQGVKKAEKLIPDLVISDVMMPKMDGNELTRILKNDEKTSHIPIILLTAKSEQESKLEGLETGADDYLTKPFDTKELHVRIRNLINIRKKLQEKFGRGEYIPTTDGKKLSNPEEQFMRKIVDVIENHISEEGFGIEQFAREVYMSRMQLHRKLKALTGKSASLYVRSFRLLRAKKMIEEKQGNFSEIAYSVGFSSPAYFTKCFKDEFGVPPSEYQPG